MFYIFITLAFIYGCYAYYGTFLNCIMVSQEYILQFIKKNDCFVYRKGTRERSKLNEKPAVVKISNSKNSKALYTLIKTTQCEDNKLCINKELANSLGLKEEDSVKLENVDESRFTTVQKVYCRVSEKDHKKSISCAKRLEDIILNQVRFVSVNNTLPLWINDQIFILIEIVDLHPSCEVGMMSADTEVEFQVLDKPRPAQSDSMFMSLYSNFFFPNKVDLGFAEFDIGPKYARICSLKSEIEGSNTGSGSYCVFVKTKSHTHQTLEVSESYPNFMFDQLNFKSDAQTNLQFLGQITKLALTMNLSIDNYSTDSAGSTTVLNQPLHDSKKNHISISNQKIDSAQATKNSCTNTIDDENVNDEDVLSVYMNKELLRKLRLKEGAKFELSKGKIWNKLDPDGPAVDSLGFNREKLFLKHLDCTLVSLAKQIRSYLLHGHLHGDNILLWGNEGCGKTTMCETLQDELENAGPESIHCQLIDCKPMKGKISNVIEKQLRDILSRACYMEPACVILDQVDILCSHVKDSQDMSAVIQSYKLCSLFVSLVREFQGNNNIMIMGVTSNKDIIKSTRASLVFSHCYSLPTLDQINRSLLVQKLISFKLNADCVNMNDIDVNKVSEKCEGYSIQDMCDVVDKALFHYLHNMVDQSQICLENKIPGSKVPKFSTKDLEEALQSHVPLALKGIKVDPVEPTNFSHVGGLRSAKELLIETLVWPSKYPEIYSQCPLKPQSGVLLYGAPGTGKTLLASAISGECGLKFISIKGPELFSKFIGESEEGVRKIFNRARSIQPCVLFFDEFDSLAAKRGNDSTGVKDRVVNQLLTELDGVEGLEGVYVVGATSRPDIIDPALLRPGRLGTAIHCAVPDQMEREDILRVLTKQVKLAKDVNLTEIAMKTDAFTGADLRGLLCSAQMLKEDANEDLLEDPIICQTDLLKVLEDTEPSLSPLDNLKFSQIYFNFVNKKGLTTEDLQKQKVISA